MAISMVVLLITGIFPIIGIEFAWLTIHWIAGLVLTAVVLFHIVRSIMQKEPGNGMDQPRGTCARRSSNEQKPGKYSLAQKGMHAAVTVVTLLVIGSGLVMFAMIDTPWWDRTNSLVGIDPRAGCS